MPGTTASFSSSRISSLRAVNYPSSTNCGTTIPLHLQVGQEEYYDYIFPEEAGAAPHLKLLELAYKHKRQKMAEDGEQKLADAAAAAEEDGDDATKQGGDDDDDEGGA